MGITVPQRVACYNVLKLNLPPSSVLLWTLRKQHRLTRVCVLSYHNKMKRFLRTALMFVRFLFLILFSLAVTMEQEYCMPEDHTNVAIPFRLLYRGKLNFWKSRPNSCF